MNNGQENEGRPGDIDPRNLPIIAEDYGNGRPTLQYSTISSNLPKLDGTNYHSWIEMQQLALEIRGWRGAIDGRPVSSTINAQAKLMLLEGMNESHRAQVRGCHTAKDIIDRLRLIYADRSAANLYRLLHQYYRYSKNPNDSMSEHIGKMDEMRHKLADLGEKQSEAVYQVTLIGSLPQEYGSLMELWELTHESMRTTENLVSRLLKREEDLKKVGGAAQALVTVSGRSGRPRMSPEDWAEHLKKTTCYNCQEKGHMARNCKKPKKTRPETENVKSIESDNPERSQTAHVSRGEVNFMVNDGYPGLKDKWICDSGASSHMCNNIKWFENIRMFNDAELGKCYIGDGKPVAIKGVGTVRVESLVDGEWIKTRLRNVQYVPQLSSNLISVGQASEHNVNTSFWKDSCIMSMNGQQVAHGARLGDGLYLMSMRPSPVEQAALSVKGDKTLDYYHRVLGHTSVSKIKTLLKDLGLPYKDNTQTIECEDCPGGKGRHVPHPSVGVRASSPEVIHADLSGLVNKTSIQGFKYYLVCKDELTEFTFVYCCKEKRDVPSLISKMFIDFEVISGHRVTELHSDNGSEFVNEATNILLQKERVKHTTSTPFCPQQNGRIEREIQTLTTMARIMLNASGLQKELWPQAIEAAAHLKNRLPTSRSNLTPFERLTSRKPHIEHLVEFGTPVHLVINDRYLTKWDCRTVPGFVVGFTNRRNTYQVYVPSRNRVIESCDLYFAKHHQENKCTPEAGKESEETVTQKVEGCKRVIEEILTEDGTHGPSTSTPLNTAKEGPSVVTGKRLQEFFDQYVGTSQNEHQEGETGHTKRQGSYESSTKPEDIYENLQTPARASSHDSTKYITIQAQNEKLPQPTAPPEWQYPCTETRCYSLDPLELEKSGGNLTPDRESDSTTTQTSHLMMIAHTREEPPLTFYEAMNGDDRDAWAEAVAIELKALQENNTWTEVNEPNEVRLLSSKWVFTLKRDRYGNIERHKARLVVRGFEQRRGVDFYETFAPVARLESIRCLLAIAAVEKMILVQFDISTAFLNGKIHENVYLAAPMGLRLQTGRCLKLNKALYGLKQAPRAWNSTFNETLIQLGFKPTLSDACVYTNQDFSVILALYVDDGIIVSKQEDKCLRLIEKLEEKFKMKRLDGNFFLGIDIDQSGGAVRLSQKRYATDILERFNMADARTVTSPIVDCKRLMMEESPETKAPYREAIGCLQYLACVTRPDISFAVSFLASFNSNPKECHWEAVKRVLRYVKHTLDYGLTYCSDKFEIVAFSDADWGNDLEIRRSVTGLLILLGGGPIIFSSRKQSTIAQSTTEAEYVAACETAKELKWLVQFLKELNINFTKPRLLVDNTSAILQISNTDINRRCKHIELRFHFVKLEHQLGLFSIEKIDTHKQVADLLTKGLSGPQIEFLAKEANMGRPPTSSKSISKVALFLVLALGISGIGTTDVSHVELTTHEILMETDIQAARGINIINLDAQFPNICQIPETNATRSVYNIKTDSYKQYQGYCQTAFQELSDTLQLLSVCLPEPIWKTTLTRIKRFFDPVTALVVISVFAVVWAGRTIVKYLDPNSSLNMLKDHQTHIEKLKEHGAQTLAESETIQKLLNETAERAMTNERALKQSASIHTELAWQSSSTNLRIWSIKEGLRELQDACTLQRLSLTGLQRFVPLHTIPALATAKERDTRVQRMEVLGKDTLSFTVQVNVIDPRSAIYRVVGLSHWTNITTRPVWVDYYGPSYMIMNSTSNCHRGIDEPTGKVSFETCEEQNYRDPTLRDYRPAANQEDATVKTHFKPFVYDTGNDHIIYCLYDNITINGRAYPCPAEPIKLDKGIEFSLGNLTYHVGLLSINRVKGRVHIETERLLNITSPEFQRTAEMWETIKNNNEEAKKRLKFDVTSNTAAINMSITEWILYALSAIASLITIGMFAGRWIAGGVAQGGSRESKQEEELHSETHSECINININTEGHTERKAYLETVASPAATKPKSHETIIYPGVRPLPPLPKV